VWKHRRSAEHFQWLTEEQSGNLPPEKLAEVREEIGDVMIYLTELAEKLGIDPVEAAKATLSALSGGEQSRFRSAL
jgi:NTP pyrophosphatase (non-canonical NTP hydrolase)